MHLEYSSTPVLVLSGLSTGVTVPPTYTNNSSTGVQGTAVLRVLPIVLVFKNNDYYWYGGRDA